MTDLETKKEQISAQLEFLCKLNPFQMVVGPIIDVEFHEVKPQQENNENT